MLQKQTLFAILTIQFFYFHCRAQTIYVNAMQTTNGDGITWATAYNNLQSAIEVATPANEIWVAQGTYYPSKDKLGSTTPVDDRTKTFYINKNIKLFGGFIGTETALAQRNINNTTTISGDIGIASNITDNAYHVIYIDGASSAGNIDNTCILNGFTIKAGNAVGIDLLSNYGGGLFCNGDGIGKVCNPTIINNIFRNNNANNSGGAILNFAFYGECSPKIINCYFLSNSAYSNDLNTGSFGGAIYNLIIEGNCSPIISRCFFALNNSKIYGGAICGMSSSGVSNPIITNSVFIANNSKYGGGIYLRSYGDVSKSSLSIPELANCVFANNTASYGGALEINSEIHSNVYSKISNCTFWANSNSAITVGIQNIPSSISINNCIFWNNPDSFGSQQVRLWGNSIPGFNILLNNCIYSDGTLDGTINAQVGNTFTNCIEADPKFVNTNSIAGADNIYRTIDDGLSLQLGSPAINAGDNSLFPAGLATNSVQKSAKILAPQALTTDITNTVTRILETTIDIGAYETSYSTTLPLDLLQFTVAYKNEEALLYWKTSNEINSSRFDIERSIDGKNFDKIGTEKAKNNKESQTYQFADATIANMDDKNIYYRLKQFDNDGSHIYSKIIYLAIRNRNNITISPNPVSNIATLNIGKETDLIHTNTVLFDIQGRQIDIYEIGTSNDQIDLTNLPKGMYFLKFKNEKILKFLKD